MMVNRWSVRGHFQRWPKVRPSKSCTVIYRAGLAVQILNIRVLIERQVIELPKTGTRSNNTSTE